MKQIAFILFITIFFSCNGKKTASFVVEGSIKNGNAKMVFLEEDMPGNQQPVIVDSAILTKNGTFKLSTRPKEQTMFSLRTDGSPFPFALIINDAGNVQVRADLAKKPSTYSVSESVASQQLIDYDTYLNIKAQQISLVARQVDSLMKAKAADTITGNKYTDFAAAAQEMKSYTNDFLEKSTSPVLSLYVIGAFQRMSTNLGIKGYTQTELSDLINRQADKFPGNTALNDIKIKLQPHKAPDFTMPDTSGNNISLSSFRGKYVLVDFWASWCEPCRGENPNVVKAFNQFKDRNFTILSVSLDKERGPWVKAIKNDGLTWTHVSDLKFWNNAAAALYNVSSIPYNFLVDPNGNIVAEDIRGPELFSTLSKLLH